ncbi:protein AMN1 homolog isoform X2 [Lineus longissimus]|uniref:protein AMN1 homolog isoform X2 n=1 Tax=Lineus longissimus TaxID=88925 RepID=UPI00315DA60D
MAGVLDQEVAFARNKQHYAATEIGSRGVTAATLSLRAVMKNISFYINDTQRLPMNLRDRILGLMTKRGLLTDDNIGKVLHPNVKSIDLSGCDVGDVGLKKLCVCRQLRKVDLNALKEPRTNITAEGIIPVSQSCRNLEVVYLRRCPSITDEAVIALAQNCPRLRNLNIGGCPSITDRSLEALGTNLSHLRSINLSSADISDNGVFRLVSGSCKSTLMEIHISNCRNITDEAVEAVTVNCPQIKILLFHGCPNVTDQSRIALEELTMGSQAVKQVTWTVY